MAEAWIGVDLDGTLAEYHRYISPLYIGEPVPRMVERVKKWLEDGKTVKVFTSRIAHPIAGLSREEIIENIQNWCYTHIGARLPVVNEKDRYMLELWDDRAVQVVSNTGLTADEKWMSQPHIGRQEL